MRFFDHPVMAAPFASFPLETRRRSGILAPYYSHTSTRGLEVGLPYYWNIAPESDATITPVTMQKRGFQLKNQFRYLERSYAGDLKLEYMPEDSILRDKRYGASLQHAQTFRPGFTGNVDYNRVSDNRYFVDLASQVRQVSVGTLQQDGYVTYTGSAAGSGYTLQARVQHFQPLQDPLAPIVPPYHRVPQLNFSTGRNDIGGLLDGARGDEYAAFRHESLVQGSRSSASPSFAAPIISPGWFFTPKAGLRYVGYSLDRLAPGQEAGPHATIPWFSADSGLVFERDSRWFGENLTQTLEPRLFYVKVPFPNQDQMPLFGTPLPHFNSPHPFSAYRFNRDPATLLKQVDVSGQWPVAAGWYAVGRYNYSILDKRLLEGLAGFEYNAGCWVFRAVVQRIQAAAQVSSTGFYFQLEFNGVGQVGIDEVVTLLRRNVPGYSVTNPRDQALGPPSSRPRLPFEQVY